MSTASLSACAVVLVAGVCQLQAQRADALDALVVDLPRPARALALARLHAVAQAFDLDRALGCQTLRDARRERAQRLAIGAAEAAVFAQRDHQAAALVLHAQRLDQHRARLEPEFVQPRRLLAARAVERDRLALEVQRAQRAALDRRDPQAHGAAPLLAATRSSPRSSMTTSKRAGVQQRKPAVGHQAQQPQL